MNLDSLVGYASVITLGSLVLSAALAYSLGFGKGFFRGFSLRGTLEREKIGEMERIVDAGTPHPQIGVVRRRDIIDIDPDDD